MSSVKVLEKECVNTIKERGGGRGEWLPDVHLSGGRGRRGFRWSSGLAGSVEDDC